MQPGAEGSGPNMPLSRWTWTRRWPTISGRCSRRARASTSKTCSVSAGPFESGALPRNASASPLARKRRTSSRWA
eukprot:7924032-Alexandrium_andersonii.AAC.1